MIFELSNSFPLQYVPVAQRLEAASLGLDPLSRATQLARHNLRHGTGHFPRGPGIEEQGPDTPRQHILDMQRHLLAHGPHDLSDAESWKRGCSCRPFSSELRISASTFSKSDP